MGWVHNTGWQPAYAHEGYAASVLDDGTDTGAWSAEIGQRVTGWRAACECGWRGGTFYPRAEWPSESGMAPPNVDGDEAGGGCYREWHEHLHDALPELAVYDLTEEIKERQDRLGEAVKRARARGVSWSTIGRACGTTRQAAHLRWAAVVGD
jgi:hypothetical protein